ncbi:hypothetical protein BJY52DRAFT_1119174, partial [Lactarius psammicola]
EQHIYKVHRYFLVRESEFFQSLFSRPQGDFARVEGVDDEHSICIPDTTLRNLRFFFGSFTLGMNCVHVRMHNDYEPAVTNWIAMLTVSVRLIFPKVRERAIEELTACVGEIDPFDLIGLATKYDVQQRLKPAYHRIVTRADLIAHAEAEKIPFLVAVMLMRSREQYWIGHNRRGPYPLVSNIVDSEIRLMGPV